jgi:hypothetical protein
LFPRSLREPTKIVEELNKPLEVKDAVSKFFQIHFLTQDMELVVQLNRELSNFLAHWRAISPENSPDFKPEFYNKDKLEEMKATLPFFSECLQILRGKDYGAEMQQYFEDGKVYQFNDDQTHMEYREEVNKELRNGKSKTKILESLLSRPTLYDDRNKKRAVPKEQRKQYFADSRFPKPDTTPHWSEILRVTDCKDCNFRYFLHF